MPTMLHLWRYDPVTGFWRHERDTLPENADAWLARFQKDEPGVTFKVAKRKPTKAPRRA